MASKPQKVKARQPRGFSDRGAEDLRAQEKMIATIRGVYERYGFEPVETPFFEYTDALGKFLPDSDRPNEGVFSLQDDDEEWLSLRYDLTAPLARHVAQNINDITLPYRTYRAGYVFRNEKPGPGRFRQFMQFDADSVGSPGVSADAEMCMMMADVMEALGIERGQYVIRVNNRKLLDGLLDEIGLAGLENAERRLTVLRALDKRDKIGVSGVRLLLGEGRWSDGPGQGDFTTGAGLSEQQIFELIHLITTPLQLDQNELGERQPEGGVEQLGRFGSDYTRNAVSNTEMVRKLDITVSSSGLFKEGVAEISNMQSIFSAAGYLENRILIDPSVVRGLEYYTGPVYEAELLFPVVNEKGDKVVFGSVGGGGRYDGLVARFRGEQVPATGFSIGVSRLMTALKNLGRLDVEERTGPVVVTVMDRDRLADYQRLTTMLREGLNPKDANGQYVGEPIPVEMFQGNPKQFGKQLQYADRRNSPCVIIQGKDEVFHEDGTRRDVPLVQIKDLVEGKRLSAEIEDNATWRASRPAQEPVPESELVDAVRKILDAQAADRKAAATATAG